MLVPEVEFVEERRGVAPGSQVLLERCSACNRSDCRPAVGWSMVGLCNVTACRHARRSTMHKDCEAHDLLKNTKEIDRLQLELGRDLSREQQEYPNELTRSDGDYLSARTPEDDQPVEKASEQMTMQLWAPAMIATNPAMKSNASTSEAWNEEKAKMQEKMNTGIGRWNS